MRQSVRTQASSKVFSSALLSLKPLGYSALGDHKSFSLLLGWFSVPEEQSLILFVVFCESRGPCCFPFLFRRPFAMYGGHQSTTRSGMQCPKPES